MKWSGKLVGFIGPAAGKLVENSSTKQPASWSVLHLSGLWPEYLCVKQSINLVFKSGLPPTAGINSRYRISQQTERIVRVCGRQIFNDRGQFLTQ